jgi:hypothetical protein
MDQDLMRMKTAIETGHLPHDAATRAGQRSPSSQGSLGSRTEAAWNGRPLSGAE